MGTYKSRWIGGWKTIKITVNLLTFIFFGFLSRFNASSSSSHKVENGISKAPEKRFNRVSTPPSREAPFNSLDCYGVLNVHRIAL